MLFFSAILLSLVQFALLTNDPNDPCVRDMNYCLNRDGSTRCTTDSVVRASFGPHHEDKNEWLSVSLRAHQTEETSENVTISVGFTVEGRSYELYCSSDDDKHTNVHTMVLAQFDFACDFKLSLTGSDKQNPVTNTSISIDLATIDDNVPVTLGYNEVKGVVAPNLKESLFHQLSYLECYEENRMSFTDSDKKNRVLMMKNEENKEMETFIYGLTPDINSTDRLVKFTNADGVSLTVSCENSFGNLTGFVQRGDTKESIDELFTFKSLDGYRCGFKLPFVVQTNGIKFDFDSRPLDFSFSSSAGQTSSQTFYSWGHFTQIVWSSSPRTMSELKASIINAVNNFDEQFSSHDNNSQENAIPAVIVKGGDVFVPWFA